MSTEHTPAPSAEQAAEPQDVIIGALWDAWINAGVILNDGFELWLHNGKPLTAEEWVQKVNRVLAIKNEAFEKVAAVRATQPAETKPNEKPTAMERHREAMTMLDRKMYHAALHAEAEAWILCGGGEPTFTTLMNGVVEIAHRLRASQFGPEQAPVSVEQAAHEIMRVFENKMMPWSEQHNNMLKARVLPIITRACTTAAEAAEKPYQDAINEALRQLDNVGYGNGSVARVLRAALANSEAAPEEKQNV